MSQTNKEKDIGKGVHSCYTERAHEYGDILWRCEIKGRKYLIDNIPLHMSLKVFSDRKEMDLNEIKAKVKEHGLQRPDPSKLRFKTTIFTSEKDGNEYYMLLCEGTDKSCSDFYEGFKHKGTVYKKFMPHVTIDKALYDEINKDGIKPEEVKFGPLTVEHGADNTIHTFEDEMCKSEDLAKGAIKHLATALGVAGAIGLSTAAHSPEHGKVFYNSGRMLSTISQIESNEGKFTNHGQLSSGESAYGRYALTPNVIRETINLHPDLKAKYKKGTMLHGQDLHHYMQDNPSLEGILAERHLKRLEQHFGQDAEKIGFAWNQGIRNTYKAIKEKKDISNHWHVKKIRSAYFKE